MYFLSTKSNNLVNYYVGLLSYYIGVIFVHGTKQHNPYGQVAVQCIVHALRW